jgi:hypothetical protein
VLSASAGAISGRTFTSDGVIDLTAASGISLAGATANSIDLEGGSGGVTLAAASAIEFISLTSDAGDIVAGTLAASGDILAQTTAGTITGTGLTAGRDLLLRASGAQGDISVLSGTAGRDFIANGAGAVTIASGTAGRDLAAASSEGAVTLANGQAGGVVRLDAAGSVISEGRISAQQLLATAGTDILLGDVTTIASLALNAAGGRIAGDQFTSSTGVISLAAAQGVILASADGGDIDIDGGSVGVSLGSGAADRSIRLASAAGPVTAATLSAGGRIEIASGGAANLTAATAGSDLDIAAAGAVTADSLTAGGALSAGSISIRSGGILSVDRASAGRDIRFAATDISLDTAEAGDDFQASSSGTFTGRRVATTGLGEDTSETGDGPDGSNIRIAAGGALALADAAAAGRITLGSQAGTISSTGLLTGRSLNAQSAGNLDLTDVNVTTDLLLTADGGSIGGNSFASTAGAIALDARDAITLASADAAGAGSFVAGQAITLGTARTGADLRIQTSATDSAATEAPDAARTISADALTAGGNLLVDAAGAVTFGTLAIGGSGDVQSARTVTVRTAIAGTDLLLNAVESITADQATAGRDLELVTDIGLDTSRTAPRSVTVGTAQAGDDLILAAFGRVEAGMLTTTGRGADGSGLQYPDLPGAGVLVISEAGTRIGSIAAHGDILLNNIGETRGAFISTGSGGIAVETIRSGGDVNLFNDGSGVTLGTAEAAGSFTSRSGALGGFAADSVLASTGAITIAAPGDITLETGTAGGAITLASSAAAVSTGVTQAGGDIRFTAAGRASAASALAGGSLTVEAGEIDFGIGAASAGDATLTASGAVVIQQARAGDDISVTAGTTALVGTAATLGGGVDGEPDGFNVSIQSAGDLTIGEIEVVGNLRLVSTDAGILRLGGVDLPLEAGGNIFVSAISNLNLPNVTAGGSIELRSPGAIETGALIAGSGLAVIAGNAFAVDSVIANGLVLANATRIDIGTLRTTQGLRLITPGEIRLGAVDTSELTGTGSTVTAGNLTVAGNISLTAVTGDVSVETARAGGDLSLSGASVALANGEAGRDLSLTGSSVSLANGTAGRVMRLAAIGDITVGTAQSGGDFEAVAGGGFAANSVVTTGRSGEQPGGSVTLPFVRTASASAIDAETSASLLAETSGRDTAGSDIRVTAAGPVRLDRGDAAGALSLISSGAAISSAELLKAAGDVVLTGSTGVQALRVDAGGRAIFAAPNGAVLVSQDLKSAQPVDATGRAVTLNAVGPLSVRTATASAGNVALTSGGGLTVQTADASGNLTASSGGTLALNGAINGTQLNFTSTDIVIGAQAQVGSAARTGTVQITANGGAAPIVIGGTGQGSGYRLDNAEFGRITARDVLISGAGQNATMQVEALTLRGAGSGTTYNVRDTLTLASGGDIRFTGRLAIETAGESNIVRVTSGRTVLADISGGGISVTNAAGALTGRVELEGRDIVVASQQAIADIQSAPDAEARRNGSARMTGRPRMAASSGPARSGSPRASASSSRTAAPIAAIRTTARVSAPVPAGSPLPRGAPRRSR